MRGVAQDVLLYQQSAVLGQRLGQMLQDFNADGIAIVVETAPDPVDECSYV